MATYTGIKKIKIGSNVFELAVDWSAVTSKPTIPTNTDEKVKQTNTTTSATYELLFSYTADNTERTEGTRKTNTLTYNPSTKELVNGVAKLKSATSTTANTAAYNTLTLGNNVAVSSTTAHSQGQLILYGSTAYAHTIQGAPTAARTITLPDATGTISLFSGSYNDLSDKPTIPTIPSNNVTGSGTSGYLTKWNGTNTITNGPQLGSSTTTYLRNDGSWATPAYPVTSVNTKTGAISLTAADIGIKFGYTTSGNNRAVQQDSSGNLYVVQKDDNSDTKATQTLVTSGMYRVLLTYTGKNSDTENSVTNVTRRADTLWYDCDAYTLHNNVCNWSSKTSTTANTAAYSTLILGNNKAVSTTSAHSQGVLTLYSDNTSYGELKQASVTSSVTHTLPATGGTILNTGTTSFTQSLTSGTTVGTIKINGSSTTLYAPTNTDAKVTQTADSGSSWRKILTSYNSGSAATTSITSGSTNTSYYNNNVSIQPSTGSMYVGGSYYMYLNESTSDALYSAINDLGWTSDVIE